jgi:multiple sugar transport system permease protein
MKMTKRLMRGNIIPALLMIILLVIVVHPFLWLIISSFKTDPQLLAYPPKLFSGDLIERNFTRVWESLPLMDFLKNTIIFAFGTALVSTLFDSMAGYAFARIRFKGSKPLFLLILVTMMIPYQAIMIPLFVEVYKFGMLDTYWGLILPRACSAFGIFMMRSFFVSLPKELEEAGRIDGFNEFKIYWKIMLPLCKPALITLLIFILMNNWNDLLYPLMLTSSTEMRTLSAGLAFFVGDKAIEYGPTLAASIISLLPLIILYMLAQRFFVQGVATSGLKG